LAVDAYVLPRVLLLLAGGAIGLLICIAMLQTSPQPWAGLGLPALAVALAALLAMTFSVSPWASLAGQYLRYESAVVRLGYLLLFGVTACLLSAAGDADRRRVVSWYLLGCCAASAEAAWEWFAAGHGLPGGLARPDGNLGNAGLLGAVDAMAVPLLLGRILGRGWRWALALVPVLVGLATSTSRSAWLAALLAGCVVVALRVPRRRLGLVAGGAVLLALAAAIVVVGPLGGLNSDPYSLRLTLWARVVPMIQARPLFGWGEDTMGLVFGGYAHGYLPGLTFDRAHSQLLDLAVAQGLVGVAASAWFWGSFAAGSLRAGRWRAGECAGLLAALLAYSAWAAVNFDWVPATAPAWLLAGVCWATVRQSEPVRAGLSGISKVGAILAGLATLAAAFVFGVLPVAADIASRGGQLSEAVALDPLQARYHSALGGRLVATGQVAGGAAELRRAGDLGDDSASTWVELGNAERVLGDAAAASAAYARARAIDPSINLR
jgi:hypothetical protein